MFFKLGLESALGYCIDYKKKFLRKYKNLLWLGYF